MDKARDLSNIDPLTVLKGVDQRLLAEVLDIVKATSAGAGKLGTFGNGQESDRDRWGKTVPQGSKSTLNTAAKERTAPLRSILKQPSTSIKSSKVDDLESGGTVSDLQKNTMDGWLPAPSKARAKSDGERNATTKGTEEMGKVIETVVSRQFMTGARSRTGVEAANPWGVNEGHIPRCRPPFVRAVDPVIGPYQMRFPRPPPWHGEDHLRLPYPPPFAPLADGMVARPRPMAPPAEFNMGSRGRLVTPSQYDIYRQVSQFPERTGPRFMYCGDHPHFAMATDRNASFGGEVRFFPERAAGPSDVAFADPWQGPQVEPVSQMSGGRDMRVEHVPEDWKRSCFVSRKIIDHNHTRANLEDGSLNSERSSLQRDGDFQRKHDRHRRSEESASGIRREDVSRVAPGDKLADNYEMELKRKFIKKIVGVNLPCDQETHSDGSKDHARKSQRLETVDSGKLEKSDAKLSAPNAETPAPRGDYSWIIEGSSITDLDKEEERLRRKLLSEVERRKKDLERNLELYRLQNAGTEKSACELEKVLRKYSTGDWTDSSSSFKASFPDVEFKDFCGFSSRKMEAGDVDVDSEDGNSKTQVSFISPDFISVCKSLAATIERTNKTVPKKEQSEVDKRMSPDAAEKFSVITSEAQKLTFAPERDIRRPTPELNTKSSLDGSTTTKTTTVNRNEVPYPPKPPPSSSASASPSSAKFAKEPGSSSVRSSTASTSGRANRITESETGKFTEFLKEERAAFWENLKAQLGERYSSQAPFGEESKTKTEEKGVHFPPSNSDCPDGTKTADLGDNKMESKDTERLEDLEVKAKKRQASDRNKESIQIGKPRVDDTVGDVELKIQPKTFSKERNGNKAVGKETKKKPEEDKRQTQNAGHEKKAFEDNLKTFQEDADWRSLIPEAGSSKDDLRRGEAGVKRKPFSSSNVALKRSKIVHGLPRKAGAGTRTSGQRSEGCELQQKTREDADWRRLIPEAVSSKDDLQRGEAGVKRKPFSSSNVASKRSKIVRGFLGQRNEGCEFQQKTDPKPVSKDTDSRFQVARKSSQSVKNFLLHDRVSQRKSAQLKKKTHPGKHLASSDHKPKKEAILYSDIEDVESSEEEDLHSLDRRSNDDVNRETEIKDIRKRSHEDYDGRHLDGDVAAVGQNQRSYGFDSANKRQNRRGFRIRLSANSGRRHVEGFDPPGVSEASRKKRGFKDVDMRDHNQGYRAGDFSGRDEANPADHGDFPRYRNRYPRGRFGNRHMASGLRDHFQKNFDNSDAKEFDKSRHDNDDRKDQRFPRDWHLHGYPEKHAVLSGSKRGSRQPYGRRCSNDGRNDDEVAYNEQGYTPDPVFEDTWNQGGANFRRAPSSGQCPDGNMAMPKFTRPFQKEEQHFPRPEAVFRPDNLSGTLDEEYCSEEEEEELMEEEKDGDPWWDDRGLTDREVTTGGHRWKDRTFEVDAHRSRAFHRGNAANMKQRFWKHKSWNNANCTGVRLPGVAYRQNFAHKCRNKAGFTKAKASGDVTEKAWNCEGTWPPATSHSLQDIIKDVMTKVEEAESIDPAADDAMFQSLSRGEQKQVLEVQQMTGIASKTVIATALRTLWELEPKVVRTLGGLEPDW